MIRFRFRRLIEKMLSVKFVIFVAATILRCVGVIGCGEWLTIALVVITGREIQKFKDISFEKKVSDEESD